MSFIQPAFSAAAGMSFLVSKLKISIPLRFKFTMVLSPRDSAKFIVENAKFVKVKNVGIEKLTHEVVKGLQTKEIDIDNFSQHALHPKPNNPIALNWIFILDTLNFCFWTPGDATKWKVDGFTGYFGLCAAIHRAIKNNIDITNPNYYSKITDSELRSILMSDDKTTEVPLLEERVKCLHEVGNKLIEKYNGNFENVVKECEKSAEKLLKKIVEEFPCFRDEADFNGKRISIYKRAQILVGDVWACYRGKGIGEFNDINLITMFADYRIPQVLVHFESLEYTSELMELLKSDKILQNGDPEEVEIRGASIYIVEQVKDRVLDWIAKECPDDISQENVNSILLDHFLWDYRRFFAKQLEYIPFHKVLSVYY